LNSDVSQSAQTFRLLFGDLIQEALTLLVGVGIMIYLSWQLTGMIALVLPLLVLLVVRFGKKVRKKSLKRQQKVGDQMGSMFQMFSGIKVVKAFRMEETESRRFRAVNDELFRRQMKVVKTQEMSKGFTELFNNFTYIMFIGVGIYAIMKEMLGLTLPVLVAFLALATTLYRPIKHLSRSYNNISDSMAGIERVTEILDLEAETPGQEGSEILTDIRQDIRFENVSFSYGGEQKVLKDIGLEIGKGQTVALVGKTGVGKTTLSDLIPRFYDPTEGRILIDGTDIRTFSRDSLLRHIAVVTQDPFLFDTSVEDNIRYGRLDATEEEIIEAARAAFIHDRILDLPEGYKTRVGDRGARLSGGERQRITIARAILRNPSILILDEATSSLDAESEQWVKKAIDNLMEGRTTVAIAHRLSTIRNADKIVVLEDGRISMMGRHDELMRQGGLYRELCAMQFQQDDTGPVTNSRSA
jgi:subfamily B ATP-binding cassette protein MsbA